ncbi:39S ribosomal protein L47, mitochondrial [Spea bombifrons]|uniref:39S ribosomal protein L47, mitochondrial n=1 Tax=Spea bombifrons TaxID=233779 RepID=UPI00234BCF2D|nr:39S ribosomal protein L47, mitochondrial [Spea bombifrons]
MAATSVCRLLSGCRNLWVGAGMMRSLQSAGRVSGGLSGIFHSAMMKPTSECKFLHSTAACNSLQEFFDDPKNWGEPTVKSGDAWTSKQLRGKSNEDLHKLWYVLLKEKNMLLTLEQESKRQRLAMPSPERLRKVNKSMERLDTVITEREDALRLLQTGQENPYPGDWRKNVFGETYWYTCKEWPMPWYMNKGYKAKKFFALPYVDHYVRLKIEKQLRIRSRKRRAEKKRICDLQKRFPHMASSS